MGKSVDFTLARTGLMEMAKRSESLSTGKNFLAHSKSQEISMLTALMHRREIFLPRSWTKLIW